MYSKILVTGASGWLGQGLVNALKNGLPEVKELEKPYFSCPIKVMLLPEDSLSFKEKFPGVEVFVGDITDKCRVKKFLENEENSCLFHLAGVIHPKLFVKEFFEVNVKGSKHLLNEAIKSKVKRVIVMSSNSPIGCNPNNDHYFDEKSPFNPYMKYGASKKELENFVESIKKEIETVIIRSPWFYGPYQPQRQIEFFEMIRKGNGPIIGDGRNRRSMAFIENIVQGLLLASIKKNAKGEIFWIADERPYSMNKIINTIERLLEEEFNQKCNYGRLKLPNFTSDIAYLIDKILQSLGLYHQKIHVLSEMNKNIICSIKKAKSQLGYNPNINIEEGMRRSLSEFYKDEQANK